MTGNPDRTPIVDCDQHYYEARDAFTRYIDEEYKVRSLVNETGPNNENYMFINGEPVIEYPTWYPPLDPETGTDDFFAMLAADDNGQDGRPADTPPEYFSAMPAIFRDRDARLELLDRQGLDAAILLPTVGVMFQEQIKHDIDLSFAVSRAFNRWIEDDWGYAYQGRLLAVPTIPLADPQAAVDELDRVVALGARVVHIHTGPVLGRSPADVRFDPFWQRVVHHDVAVAFHLGVANYRTPMSRMWGAELAPDNMPQERWSAFLWTTAFGDRPIMDMLSSLVFWNLFGRYPTLRVLIIEYGVGWVEYLLRRLDKMALHGRHGAWPGGRLTERPSAILRRHVSIVPFPEDKLSRVIPYFGTDNLLFGSDYPHPEGLSHPVDMMRRKLTEVEAADTDAIMGGNAARVLSLDLARTV